MKLITNKELSSFLSEYPLYSKVKLFDTLEREEIFNISDYFENKAYKFYCPNEKEYHTFKLIDSSGYRFEIHEDEVPELYRDISKNLNFSFYLNGVCQSCEFEMDILLNMFSKTPPNDHEEFPTVYLRKLGQLPSFERNPEIEVLNYLSEEDIENYRKALANLSLSYGIGAFAYFRRIIENEIIRIVKDISTLEFDGVEKVIAAWNEYEQNHQMSNLIDNINAYIPKSLKEIGDNPIKLLHQQLSGGIHKFSEEECLEKAKQIDTLLRYVIRKVNSEKFELKDVREAMIKLKK